MEENSKIVVSIMPDRSVMIRIPAGIVSIVDHTIKDTANNQQQVIPIDSHPATNGNSTSGFVPLTDRQREVLLRAGLYRDGMSKYDAIPIISKLFEEREQRKVKQKATHIDLKPKFDYDAPGNPDPLPWEDPKQEQPEKRKRGRPRKVK